MKNKKGFTLIEIIICVVLLGTISALTVTTIKKSPETKDINVITKSILKSAEIYVNMEHDEQNNTYEYGIKNGGRGIQINLKTLVDTGYVEEKDAKYIAENNKKDIDKLYILATLSTSSEDDKTSCDTGMIKYTPNWQNTTETIYLCEYKEPDITTSDNSEGMTAQTIVNSLVYDTNKIPTTKEYYDRLSDEKKTYFSYKDNGWKSYINQDIKTAYIFARGHVENNYVKLGKDKNGNDLIWRILWKKTTFEDENYLEYKLVLDKTVPIVLKDTNGREVTMLGKTQYFLNYDNSSNERNHQKAIFTYSNLETTQSGSRYTYTYTVDHKFDSFFEYRQDHNDTDYYKYLDNWYDTTNLGTDYSALIKTTKNFCKETDYDDYERYYYSTDFNCINVNRKEVRSYKSYDNYIDRKVGMLSYGDAFLAGILPIARNSPVENDLNFSENYLMSDKKPFLLDNTAAWNRSYSKYYVNIKTGISSATTSTWRGNSSHNVYIANYNGTEIFNHSSNLDSIQTTIFIGDLKPVIIVDSKNYNLTGIGTKDNPYEFVAK